MHGMNNVAKNVSVHCYICLLPVSQSPDMQFLLGMQNTFFFMLLQQQQQQ
jgi:hypothetical protein